MYEIGFLYKKWNLQRRSDCILGKCFCQKSLKNHNLFLHFLSMLGLFQIDVLPHDQHVGLIRQLE